MRLRSLAFLLLLAASGCAPKSAPKTDAIWTLPAPPSGQAALYAAPDGISVQSHSGDCVKTPCFVFANNKWRPLPVSSAKALPLLSLSGATGGAYSEALWQSAGPDRAVLLNDTAGREALSRGVFDGLRIGLRAKGEARYLTLFAKDKNLPAVDIALSGGTAWMLARQSDGSLVLADLFALRHHPDVVCAGSIAIDAAPWAGTPENALSPDVFIARDIPAAARDTEQSRITQACPTISKG